MSTDDLGGAPFAFDAGALAKAIEELANAHFAAPPAWPTLPAAAPPIPGALHQPPIAATAPPKDSDLRAIPTLASQGPPSALTNNLPLGLAPGMPYGGFAGGLPGPQSFAGPGLPISDRPYFLEHLAAPALVQPPAQPQALVPPEAVVPPNTLVPLTGPSPVSAPEPAVASVPAAPALPLSSSYDFRPELVPFGRDPASPPPRGAFDPNAVKADFPILSERVHGGRRLVWLDNAATTQKPNSVIERLSYYYEHENSNVHRAAHVLAARATDAYEGARETVRGFINAPSKSNIVFVRGTTEGINLVAKSFGARHVYAGDEILITWLEHHANIVPWQQLCAEKGARLRVAPVDDRGQVILEEYEKLLGPKTRIVSFTQVSNALGTVTPAAEMIEMAHRYGARVHLDAAQAVSHMPVDVQDLDCDFLTFSGHKIFAPMGVGVVYGKSELLETMPPWQGGGNMIQDVTFERTVYQGPPWRFEAGTATIADAVGLGAALDYVSALGLENIGRYEHELREYAEEELRRVPGLTIIGTAPEKAGVISFVLDGVRTEDVGAALDQEGIAVRSGHHCAQPILRRFGLESTVRASLAPYNTREDVDALVAAVRRLQTGRPG